MLKLVIFRVRKEKEARVLMVRMEKMVLKDRKGLLVPRGPQVLHTV